MPQGASKKSLVVHPSWTEAQISLQDDAGVDNPIDAAVPRRELVNLESAAVSIENSSDVIIGPVTQFNVNGNIIIRHHENGWLGLEELEKKKKDEPEEETAMKLEPILLRTLLLLLNYVKLEKIRVAFITTSIVITISAITTYVILSSMFRESLEDEEDDGYCDVDHIGEYTIYSRAKWTGEKPKLTRPLPLPIGLVIISHTFTNACDSFVSCSRIVKSIQDNDLESGLSDICYNFLVGGDGSIFVGRGWQTRNCHSKLSIGISFIGDFTQQYLNMSTIDSTVKLLGMGVEMGNIAKDYLLIGHNQTTETLSPGEYAYRVIKGFPHFTDIDILRFT